MDEKITQAFIEALIAKVPDGKQLIDFRQPIRDEVFIDLDGSLKVFGRDQASFQYPILRNIPLTGKAWATANLVNRIGSVIKYEDKIWCVILNGSRIEFGLTDRCFGDFIVWNDGKGWDDWSTELDSLSDKTVTWLYKAEIREKKEDD